MDRKLPCEQIPGQTGSFFFGQTIRQKVLPTLEDKKPSRARHTPVISHKLMRLLEKIPEDSPITPISFQSPQNKQTSDPYLGLPQSANNKAKSQSHDHATEQTRECTNEFSFGGFIKQKEKTQDVFTPQEENKRIKISELKSQVQNSLRKNSLTEPSIAGDRLWPVGIFPSVGIKSGSKSANTSSRTEESSSFSKRPDLLISRALLKPTSKAFRQPPEILFLERDCLASDQKQRIFRENSNGKLRGNISITPQQSISSLAQLSPQNRIGKALYSQPNCKFGIPLQEPQLQTLVETRLHKSISTQEVVGLALKVPRWSQPSTPLSSISPLDRLTKSPMQESKERLRLELSPPQDDRVAEPKSFKILPYLHAANLHSKDLSAQVLIKRKKLDLCLSKVFE